MMLFKVILKYWEVYFMMGQYFNKPTADSFFLRVKQQVKSVY